MRKLEKLERAIVKAAKEVGFEPLVIFLAFSLSIILELATVSFMLVM